MERVAPLPFTPVAAPPRIGALSWIVSPLWLHRRALVVLNVTYFGVVAIAGGYAALNPAVQRTLLDTIDSAFSPTGALAPLVRSYVEGQLLTAIGLTFVVNLVLGTLVALTLPSLVVPFAGLAVGLYRAVLWGILFSPTPVAEPAASLMASLPLLLLEGEAYVVAMLGVWLWWSRVLTTPGRRWQSWKQGLTLQVRIYPAVMLLLALAAVYEAALVILIAR
jgi:hypothetical protein